MIITSDQIKQTKAYKKMDAIQQRITDLSASKKTIMYNVGLLQNVGLERWELLTPNLQVRWKNIVKELVQNNN